MFGQRDTSVNDDNVVTPSAPAVPAANDQTNTSTPVFTGLGVDTPAPASGSTPESQLAPSAPTPPPPSTPVAVSTPTPVDESTAEELVAMKQEALKHLQPLVDTLQQSPEEEFRTLMMMIQAADDRTLLKKALEAAKKIRDDKVRAQAMLDVINEINYFTQTSPAE